MIASGVEVPTIGTVASLSTLILAALSTLVLAALSTLVLAALSTLILAAAVPAVVVLLRIAGGTLSKVSRVGVTFVED